MCVSLQNRDQSTKGLRYNKCLNEAFPGQEEQRRLNVRRPALCSSLGFTAVHSVVSQGDPWSFLRDFDVPCRPDASQRLALSSKCVWLPCHLVEQELKHGVQPPRPVTMVDN